MNEMNWIQRPVGLCLRIFGLKLHKEKADVISEGECWVIFHRCWMYGPTPTMTETLKEMAAGWKQDRNLIG